MTANITIYILSLLNQIFVIFLPIAEGWEVHYDCTLPWGDRQEFLRRLQYMKGITFQYAFCTERAIKTLQHDESK